MVASTEKLILLLKPPRT